jgi:nicotinamide-nucleotide amidase
MQEVPELRQQIQAYFERMGAKKPSSNNWRQAMVIEGAQIVENHNGTAPGMIVDVDGKKHIILMPGPPEELKQMFEESIAPYLAGLNQQVICSKTVKLCGMGESRVAEAVADLIDAQTNPTIATYAKGGEVHLRITASGSDLKTARKSIKPIVKELKSRFGNKIYTTRESETLEQHVVGLLKRNKMTVATAESCTGGMVASTLINVPGASEVFNEGYITYSNEAKQKILGVKKKTLKKEGAVSEACAAEMAKGAAKAAEARTAISVTGIAGPDGGTEEKPVGLVYIGCCIDGKVWTECYHMNGNRQKVRELSVKKALDMLRRCLSQAEQD